MKKLNLHRVEEELLSKNLKIFTSNDLKIMFGASRRAVEGFLNYNFKKGAFVRFKKGLYGLKRNLPDEFVLANNLYSPSYISLDTALSFYNLIPETVYAITSVTTKPTRELEVLGRLFEYRKIKKQAFAGYLPQKVDDQIVFMATPEKAIADFLYFVFLGKRSFNDRLKLGKVNFTYLEKEAKLFGQERFFSFVKEILKLK